MKNVLLLILAFTCCNGLEAQYNIKENNVWAFGQFAGLDFNSGSPVPIPTHLSGYSLLTYYKIEDCASVCDTNGNLLFYSSSDTIWNKNGQVMTNGYNLMPFVDTNGHDTVYGGISTAQGSLIIPVIGNANQYYVFSLEQTDGILNEGRLFYCVVDMSLNGGLGSVLAAEKGIELDSMLSESMISIPGNNCDMWLLVHARDTNFFKAYHITNTGLDPNPVISHVGNLITSKSTYPPLAYAYGEYSCTIMKCSNDRSKIVLCNTPEGDWNNAVHGDGAELFIFNPTLGTIDSSIGVICNEYDTPRNGYITVNLPYGACFSPDNSKLYIQNTSEIYQYDLTTLQVGHMINTKAFIDTGHGFYDTDLKLGPNGKIYLHESNNDSLGVIDFPNLAGNACHYVKNAIKLASGAFNSIGFPNDYWKPNCNSLSTTTQPAKEEITLYPNPNSGTFNINASFLSAQQKVSIRILNAIGQVVYEHEKQFLGSTMDEQVSLHTAPGLYFVSITDDVGNTKGMQFVME